MLSANVAKAMAVRSSLEEMLESLRKRDELENPKDLPPALPSRPISRARGLSAKYTLPRSFSIGDAEPSSLIASTPRQEGKSKELGAKMNSFGSKKKREQSFDSPYDATESEMKSEPKLSLCSEERAANAKPFKSLLPSIPEHEFEDEISYFSKTKLRVWCRIKGGHWQSGTIQSNTGEKVSVTLSDGTVTKVSQGELFPANPSILDGVDDLIQLSYLNEPSVLYNLEYRYTHDVIYSKAGPVLIAVNPLKNVDIYGNDILMAYRQKLEDKPHVYAITDTAYNGMMRDEVNQSIIISGESGAGKTETAKRAMQYLAALGGGSSGIEDEILQSSYILEAFGNAKTSRNDNSSRFGKLVDIHFSTSGKICGANIQTFLLEKSRVVQLAYGERSYHIFYQLCAGAPTVLKESLNLKMPNEFKYLNQSNCLTINGVDDGRKLNKLMEALNTAQICKEDQEQVFAMLAAVLWLGNISFQVIDNDNHVEGVADEAVSNASRLMGCSTEDLMSALSTHQIQAGKDTISKKLTLQQAIDTRDAMAKFIYASLFEWLVEQINKSLEVGKERTGRSISILDIYGFESFPKNSFEQFCINYANERLQQHFNRHLFKLEQEEYELEGIDWTKVEFEDNQECLDLIEKKPIGLLSLLDEESNFPRGSDLTLANKLKQHLNSSRCFKGERDGAFTIRHYAANVIYDTSGFLEKNRDPVQCDSIKLLSSCSYQLPKLFASKVSSKLQKPSPSGASQLFGPRVSNRMQKPGHSGASDSQKQSVVTKFKNQLFKLMSQLESTTPHFIRCIKPNDKQLPGLYQDDLVLHQLRCCGVLEVVRISRSGYPTRMTHQEFAGRYGFLVAGINVSQDPLSLSVTVLQQFNVLPEMYQIGYTKLYLRTGQLAELEDRRKRFVYSVVWIQRCFRRYQARCNSKEFKIQVTALQSFVRGENARKEYDSLLQTCSSSFPNLDKQKGTIIHLQSVVRGWLVRKRRINAKKSRIESAEPTQKLEMNSSKVKDIPSDQVNAVLEELQRRVAKTETALGKKEEEKAALKEKVRMYEKRWSEYEVKMKSMEEMWQVQMASLQMNLAAARKSLAAENTTVVGKHDGPHSSSNDGSAGNSNGSDSGVGNLVKEFERHRQSFDDEAKSINEMKQQTNSSSAMAQPFEELKKLKRRFESWKKDFKRRMEEAKVRLSKQGNVDVEKRRKWWGKIRAST